MKSNKLQNLTLKRKFIPDLIWLQIKKIWLAAMSLVENVHHKITTQVLIGSGKIIRMNKFKPNWIRLFVQAQILSNSLTDVMAKAFKVPLLCL